MAGDSHTGFNSGGFSAGAVGGALTIAGAVIAGAQAAAHLNSRRWADWERHQLEAALDLSEALKTHLVEENDELRTENAKLKLAMRRVAMRRASR